jgi:hypothetical protein
MGALKRVASFGTGGVLGFLVGAAVSTLTAPQSGGELRSRLRERAGEVKAAGDAAQAAVEAELIGRFRSDVDDPQALAPEAERATLRRSRALSALGLGLGAQGAYATQEMRDRAGDAGTGPLDLQRTP